MGHGFRDVGGHSYRTMLREEWQSDAIIQTDCCDSIQTMSDFNKSLTKQAALAKAVNDGLGVYFG